MGGEATLVAPILLLLLLDSSLLTSAAVADSAEEELEELDDELDDELDKLELDKLDVLDVLDELGEADDDATDELIEDEEDEDEDEEDVKTDSFLIIGFAGSTKASGDVGKAFLHSRKVSAWALLTFLCFSISDVRLWSSASCLTLSPSRASRSRLSSAPISFSTSTFTDRRRATSKWP